MKLKKDWKAEYQRIQKIMASEWSGILRALSEEEIDDWNAAAATVRFDECLMAIRIDDQRITLQKNLNLVSTIRSEDFAKEEFFSLYHPEQRDVLVYTAQRVFLILFEYRKRINDQAFHLKWLRALKTKNGDYYYVKYVCTPFQYTNKGVMFSYLGHVSLLKKYEGEPLHLEACYSGPESAKARVTLKDLQQDIENINASVLTDVFGIKGRRLEAIKLFGEGATVAQVAKQMKIKPSGADYHRKEIIKFGKRQFPTARLVTIGDIVTFFQVQGFV